jgi:hypothetical protein
MSKRSKPQLFYKVLSSLTYRFKIRGRRKKRRNLQAKRPRRKSQPRGKRSLRNPKKSQRKRRRRG